MLSQYIPVIAVPLCFLIVVILALVMWKRVPQDKAGVVTGFKRRVLIGKGGFIIPILERIDLIPLNSIPLHITVKRVQSSQGIPISLNATALIKIKSSVDSVLSATEQFISRKTDEFEDVIKSSVLVILECKLREIIETLTVEDLYHKHEEFYSLVKDVITPELDSIGIEIKNFTILDIFDDNGYIKAIDDYMISRCNGSDKAQKYDIENIRLEAQAYAEAVKTKSEADAEAIKVRSEAKATAVTLVSSAKAEATKSKGFAKADVKKAMLVSEAEGIERKAEALRKLNEAGLIQTVVDKLPEIASAVSKPLDQIDAIKQ